MSQQTNFPLQNDTRYEVTLSTLRQQSYIIYQISIQDLAIGIAYEARFRFSEIKKMHEQLIVKYKAIKDIFPELPKTNSFCLWNRTNKDHRKIQERRRELEFYLNRIVNNAVLRNLAEIKGLLINGSKVINRTQSSFPFQMEVGRRKRAKSLPLDQKQKLMVN